MLQIFEYSKRLQSVRGANYHVGAFSMQNSRIKSMRKDLFGSKKAGDHVLFPREYVYLMEPTNQKSGSNLYLVAFILLHVWSFNKANERLGPPSFGVLCFFHHIYLRNFCNPWSFNETLHVRWCDIFCLQRLRMERSCMRLLRLSSAY